MKKFTEKTVYEAAVERIDFIFDHFEKVYVSFSGGKDSGVLLNLAIDVARKRGRKIGVLFIDLEAFYKKTIAFVEKMLTDNEDVIEPFWVCLPMESPNSVSYLDPTWIWWDQAKKPLWVRPMPQNQWVVHEGNHTFSFYRKNMPFEKFIVGFGPWYGGGQKTACLVGIRADESLNRYRAITAKKENYLGRNYSTKAAKNTYNFYPLYDWRVEDVWIYNGKFQKEYNRLYDLFYRAGISIHKMRVDEPFGNEAKAGLNLFRVIEPETWARVVNRVSGANFGNIYSRTKIMTGDYTLPENHSWKSFTKFLLSTLPKKTADQYRRKFIKFIRYWHKTGCPMNADFIKELEKDHADAIFNTHKYSRRGSGDKEVVKFKKIVDSCPNVDSKDDILTWKRMAMCIIKNDLSCQSLSFGATQKQIARRKALIEKYKNI